MSDIQARTKSTIKQLVGRFIRIALARSSRVGNFNIILMYHRVLDSPPKGICEESLYVQPSTLEMHLKEISKVFKLVPLIDLIRVGDKSKGLCAITFDDGWIDTYLFAFPILEKLKVPATVFLPTSLVGKEDCFWFERITRLANIAVERGIQNQFFRYFGKLVPEWKEGKLSSKSVSSLISLLKEFAADSMDEIVSRAYLELKISPAGEKVILGWGEIEEMRKSGISFGPHGTRHLILPSLDREVKRREIMEPLKSFHEKGVSTIPVFSYPNGNWDRDSLGYLLEAGYEAAVTTKLGYNTAKANKYLMNRIGLHEGISSDPDLLWFRVFQAVLAGP